MTQDRDLGVVKADRIPALTLDFHKGIDRCKRLASGIKTLLVINIHGMDDPVFDVFQVHHGEGPRGVHDELKAEFRVGTDDHLKPMQHKSLLRRTAKGELLCGSRSIAPGGQHCIEHLIQARLDFNCS